MVARDLGYTYTDFMRSISGPREIALLMAHYEMHPRDEVSWEQSATIAYCAANRFKKPIPIDKLKPTRAEEPMTADQLEMAFDALPSK